MKKPLAKSPYTLLQRQPSAADSEFVTKSITNTDPVFVVVDSDIALFGPGTLVVPNPNALIRTEIGGEEYFWCKLEDIMGALPDAA